VRRLLDTIRASKLDRVAVAYAAIAWLAVQVIATAASAFSWPAWTIQSAIVLAIAGFPAALLTVWISTHRESGRSFFHPTSAEMQVLVGLVVLFVSAAAVFAWAFWPREASRLANAPKPAVPMVQGHSIAVLPFVNMTGDPQKKYLSDGIADQLIGDLARIPDLHVAARTSSFAFEGKNSDIRSMARSLGVRTILEGSVREEGDRIRIMAQLIDASNGFQIWSQTYDRELKGILSLQDDIARAIEAALTNRLQAQGSSGRRTPGSINPDAFKALLEARFFLGQRTEASITRAIPILEKAIALQPDYADAYASLGFAHIALAFNYDKSEHIALALMPVRNALDIDPDNTDALDARVSLSLLKWDWRAAWTDVKRLTSTSAGAARAWHSAAIFYSAMGLLKQALVMEKRAIALDPLSYIDRLNLALNYTTLGLHRDAINVANTALDLQPGHPEALALICENRAALGDFAAARATLGQLTANKAPGLSIALCSFYIAYYTKDVAGMRKLLDAVAANFDKSGASPVDLAIGYRMAGDNEKALEWSERAFEEKSLAVLSAEEYGIGPRTMFADPRWKAMRNTAEVHEWEAMRGEIASQVAGE
jgi:adenylate cyclase